MKSSVCTGNLILVNAQHPIHSGEPADLTSVSPAFPEITLRQEAQRALQGALDRINSGDRIVPVSGYRSREEQVEIYESSLLENGAEFTRKYVALPDCSEHQTGFAIDLALNQDEIDFIRPDFPYHGICNEFRRIAPDYGFIQRYTKEKEAITGISHEPWHFRFVGCPHARIMTDKGLCLEEYIDFIKSYRSDCRLICRQEQDVQAEVYYVCAKDEISAPDACQISGNNTDGWVVTVWRNTDERK